MRIRDYLKLLALIIVTPTTAFAQGRSEAVLFEQSFDVRAGGQLEADFGDMDIQVTAGSGSTATVRVVAWSRSPEWAREVFANMNFEAGAAGGDLTLRTREVRMDWREWQRNGGVGFRAEVTVPGEYDLDLETGDGDIGIGSFEGRLSAHSGDGDITIRSARGSAIELRTGDGDVTAESLTADDIQLHTGDGDLFLERVAGPISAVSGDGDVSMGIERFEGVSIRTGDGDVRVEVDEDIAADLDIEGEDLDLARGLTVTGRVRDGRVAGQLNGGGPELRVRTGDGDVTVRAR